ncbi:GTPase involved in cell partioning and DNA repair [[Clostridium] ultunense Esp]|nr:GTPase involved in cell partioning and DNA repair [[Clostridium] ultunense Esp]
MFVDEAKIYVKGGDGGNGIIAFRREKYVDRGGPWGGDGGKGGDVVFVVDEGLRTLIDFKYRKHFKAPKGENGRTKNQHGAGAEDLVVKVPPGTVLYDDDTGEMIADMVTPGQRVVVARGGRGGRGNVRFATPKNPAPYIAEKGEPGEERYIRMELKVIADVGLVGYPSVGKSTLISVVSGARPKIASYPFTTLSPNLGVVEIEEGRGFVMADLPGLIEGAHEGVGLGHQFLRHVERTRLILHVIDMAAVEGRDPYQDYLVINEELRRYNPRLAQRPQMIAANKMDLPEAEENLARFKEKIPPEIPVYPISAATRQGIKELIFAIAERLETLPAETPIEEKKEEPERRIYRAKEEEPAFTVQRENEMFVVVSPRLERMVSRLDLSYEDAAERFAFILRRMGVDDALREMGAKDGDSVRIGELIFEFID